LKNDVKEAEMNQSGTAGAVSLTVLWDLSKSPGNKTERRKDEIAEENCH